MAEIRVVAKMEDGSEIDVTEAVQTMYDLVTQSMDWGSGFLTVEDALPVVHVAKTCGFKGYEEAERYVEAQRKSEEQQRLRQIRAQEKCAQAERDYRLLLEHDHVWSPEGPCVWPKCGHVMPALAYDLRVKGSDDLPHEEEWRVGNDYRIRVRINGNVTAETRAALEIRAAEDWVAAQDGTNGGTT